jgi:uncharacterized protein YpmS
MKWKLVSLVYLSCETLFAFICVSRVVSGTEENNSTYLSSMDVVKGDLSNRVTTETDCVLTAIS